jgi:proteasome component ECM29
LLRLGSANTDEQLENTVNKFLAPVLLKITSPHEPVRRKVMEILTHINKRLKSLPQIIISLEPLLKQYQDSESSFLLNFAIIYITMGFPRLSNQKQTEIAPVVLQCLEGKPEPHQDKLMMLILPLLGEIKIPQDPVKREALLGLDNKPNTKTSLLALMMDVLLMPYGLTEEAEVPPGMSQYSFKRVNQLALSAENLEQMKKGIVRFLTSNVFPEMDTVAHLIVASADTRFSVATPALAELNKIASSLDWSYSPMAASFYVLLAGNYSKIADRKSSPCNARVKQKMLTYMQKLKGEALNVAKGIQVIFETLFGTHSNTNQKCKILALQFAQNLISQ